MTTEVSSDDIAIVLCRALRRGDDWDTVSHIAKELMDVFQASGTKFDSLSFLSKTMGLKK